MRIDDQLYHPEYLTTQMERIAEATFLSLFCGECLNWLQVEIVVQMQEIQIFAVDQ